VVPVMVMSFSSRWSVESVVGRRLPVRVPRPDTVGTYIWFGLGAPVDVSGSPIGQFEVGHAENCQ